MGEVLSTLQTELLSVFKGVEDRTEKANLQEAGEIPSMVARMLLHNATMLHLQYYLCLKYPFAPLHGAKSPYTFKQTMTPFEMFFGCPQMPYYFIPCVRCLGSWTR